MKRLVTQTSRAAGLLKRAAALAFVAVGMASVSLAEDVTDPLQTAATDAIADAKGIVTTILIAAFGIVVGFVVFKVIKRGISKI